MKKEKIVNRIGTFLWATSFITLWFNMLLWGFSLIFALIFWNIERKEISKEKFLLMIFTSFCIGLWSMYTFLT